MERGGEERKGEKRREREGLPCALRPKRFFVRDDTSVLIVPVRRNFITTKIRSDTRKRGRVGVFVCLFVCLRIVCAKTMIKIKVPRAERR